MSNLNFDRLGYNDNDFFPRDTVLYRVTGTQTSATNAWLGILPEGITAYSDGLTIDYYLPVAGTSTAATLNLSGTGAKPVYCSANSVVTAVTTHIPAQTVVRLTYIVNSNINSGNGAWLAMGDWTPNTAASASVTTATVSNVSVTSGTTPTLTQETISCDDITNWDAGTMFSASISEGILTLSSGTVPTLSYTEKSVNSVDSWSAGTVTTVTDTPTTVVTSVTISST